MPQMPIIRAAVGEQGVADGFTEAVSGNGYLAGYAYNIRERRHQRHDDISLAGGRGDEDVHQQVYDEHTDCGKSSRQCTERNGYGVYDGVHDICIGHYHAKGIGKSPPSSAEYVIVFAPAANDFSIWSGVMPPMMPDAKARIIMQAPS